MCPLFPFGDSKLECRVFLPKRPSGETAETGEFHLERNTLAIGPFSRPGAYINAYAIRLGCALGCALGSAHGERRGRPGPNCSPGRPSGSGSTVPRARARPWAIKASPTAPPPYKRPMVTRPGARFLFLTSPPRFPVLFSFESGSLPPSRRSLKCDPAPMGAS